MKQYDLSIIIPAYNSERTIERCLNSIYNQTDSNRYQIIVINDGSTDNTKEIVEKYALTHPNLTLINQKNQHVSVARNNGINIATGEYITFIDPDDMVGADIKKIKTQFENVTHKLQPIDGAMLLEYETKFGDSTSLATYANQIHYETEYFTRLLNNSHGCDIVRGEVLLVDYDLNLISHIKNPANYNFSINTDVGKFCSMAEIPTQTLNANYTLFKRETITNNNIRFLPGFKLDEDFLFYMTTILYAKSVSKVTNSTYIYFRNPGSLSCGNTWEEIIHATLIEYSFILLLMKQHNRFFQKTYNFLLNYFIEEYGMFNYCTQYRKNFIPNCGLCNGICTNCSSADQQYKKLFETNLRTLSPTALNELKRYK